jgi:hypothetical protein
MVNFSGPIEVSMMGSLKRTSCMAMESIRGGTGAVIRDPGITTKCTAVVHSSGQTDVAIQASILMIKSMGTEHSFGQKERFMKDNGSTENSMVSGISLLQEAH